MQSHLFYSQIFHSLRVCHFEWFLSWRIHQDIYKCHLLQQFILLKKGLQSRIHFGNITCLFHLVGRFATHPHNKLCIGWHSMEVKPYRSYLLLVVLSPLRKLLITCFQLSTPCILDQIIQLGSLIHFSGVGSRWCYSVGIFLWLVSKYQWIVFEWLVINSDHLHILELLEVVETSSKFLILPTTIGSHWFISNKKIIRPINHQINI